MNAASRASRLAVLAVFIVALLLRVYRINLPFVEPYNSLTRQALCGMTARNFYEHGFNLFYPEIDENGPGPYLYNVEFPLYAYLMALGYKLAGGVKEAAARSVSVAFSMLFLWSLFLLIKKLRDKKTAAITVLFTALSPLVLSLSRSVQPDITALFAGSAALYLFYKYTEHEERGFFAYSALFLLFAVATRIFLLYLFVPILYMAWTRQGWRLLKDGKNYAYVFCVSLAFLWYAYMFWAGKSLSLAYNPYVFAPNHGLATRTYWQSFMPSDLLSAAKILCLHLLTPAGTLFCFVGLFQRTSRSEKLFFFWLLGAILYVIIFWQTVIDHPYYQLQLAPPLFYFVARGASALWEKAGQRGALLRWFLAGAFVLIYASSLLYYYRGLYGVREEGRGIVEAGQVAENQLPPGSLVVASYGSSPIQLYYCHRKGWSFNVHRPDDEKVVDDLESLRRQGAKYYVHSRMEYLHALPHFEAYLRGHYKVIAESSRYVIFEL